MRYKAMDFFHGIRAKRGNSNFKKLLHIESLGFHGGMHLVIIRLPNSWVLKLMARALIMSLIILSLPWLNVIIAGLTSKTASSDCNVAANSFPVELFPTFYHDFANEGFLKMGDKVLFLSDGDEKDVLGTTRMNVIYKIDIVSPSDLRRQSSIPAGTYDFMLVHDFHSSSFLINRALKSLGIVVVVLGDINTSRISLKKPPNYKIIYIRRKFGSTIMAMRKMYPIIDHDRHLGTRRSLLGVATESKKAVLSHLEDVLLEPPRAASGKSTRYLKRTRYLPDLTGDSLENYPRRVFIDVNVQEKNDTSGDENWLPKHYPTRNMKFETYEVDAIAEESKASQNGMSDWLRKNVKENEYVVMKAEAEVVEEMVKTKAIRLVDELFLECKHRGIKKGAKRSRRAYWECLALYGRLRDEGIAVHQWWG